MPSTAANRLLSNRTVVLKILLHLRSRVVFPAARAFLFAYLYVTVPKVVSTVAKSYAKISPSELAARVTKTLRSALKPNKFPALAGRLSLLINLLEPLIYQAFKKGGVFKGTRQRLAASTLVSAFIASLNTFPRFQNHVAAYGRHHSLDLTLLVAVRAADTLVSSAWSSVALSDWSSAADGALFMWSCALIMYSWFLYPKRLPPAYRRWITSAAEMDDEVVEALRSLKDGSLVYGQPGPKDHLFDSYCQRYGQPETRGSLILNQPLDCETVHAFKSRSCEVHALWRFVRGFTFACKLYGTVNAVMLLIPKKSPFRARLGRALLNTGRSSAFLGSFIALCWYGVCLGRTRVLPKLFPKVPATRWDDTMCVMTGSALCGASCFVETPRRRKELALFVAPRALGTLVSLDSSPRSLRIESVVFAVSMAVLVFFAKKDSSKVRGVFGKGLELVFSLKSYN